jgi:heme-degrading monooxygenase HmoA
MYARILTAQLQPGKMDGMIDEYQKYWATVPQKGLLGGRQLVDRAADKMCSITTWETLADLEANNRAYEQDIPRYMHVFQAPPAREVYEVASEIEPARAAGIRDQGQTMQARVLTVQIQPSKVDHMIDEYQRYADTLRQQKGFQGARQLVDRAANKLVSITFWETQADLEASDGVNQRRAPDFASIFLGPPEREAYEVVAEVLPAREVGGA